MIEPWRKISSKTLGDYPVFRLRSDLKVSPKTGIKHDFYVMDAVNWVNVIALTSDGHIVLVEQFRHGTETIELEIPGGVMDPDDSSPAATGARELREETGFEGENPRVIGSVYANPAIMSNTCYTVLIENCHLSSQVEFDATEDLATKVVPIGQLPELVSAGKIKHSLVVAAFYHFDIWRKTRQA